MSSATQERAWRGRWADPAKVKRDIGTVAAFIEIFCREVHRPARKSAFECNGPVREYTEGLAPELCSECTKLLLHAATKTAMCPYDPKPKCKKCPTHCYNPRYRERIKEVMRFSGMYLMKRGKLHMAVQYFF